MSKKILIILSAALLTAYGIFGPYYESEPIGVGKGIDELKLSPCSCLQLDLPKNLPDWYIETI